MKTLHEGQVSIIKSAARFNTAACGRRFGKTILGMVLAYACLSKKRNAGWFSPTYKLLDDAWRGVKQAMDGSISRIDSSQKRIEFLNGAAIDFWTLEKPDCGRGRKYGRVIIDEAAMARNLEEAWNAAIRPTLTDYRGDAWFFSTPKGRNFFWQLAQRGEDKARWPEWATHSAPTAKNPRIDPAEIQAAKESLPERIFCQEYLAQFLDDGGGVFRRVMDAIYYDDPVIPPHGIVIGVDWGRHNDFTVMAAIDAHTKTVLAIDRFTGIDYGLQLERLKSFRELFPSAGIVAESNAMGEPLVEALQQEGLPVRAFQTTAPSKRIIIESLSLAFEKQMIRIPNVPWLIDELLAYEQERLPGGMLRYGAPPGGHDDGVMALAIAWSAVDSAGPYEYHPILSRQSLTRGARDGVW